ncbi:protein kinase domain-containing protein [Fimbriiglobus ruber]|uniref:non-specific serine/threonine protein kinase n=1 Tax=Fimbriiglobus ruber TaxID=1908690 RepID=A0A225E853_9BACT|nr:protein kinase [Fimbriiglobus ruber]OWK45689.1 Serine/threonine protein kinase PrkC, regulator of stationary phase [Fimbriiglobus ruber]
MVSPPFEPDENVLRQYLLGLLPPDELEAVGRYLDAHPELMSTLNGLHAGDTLLDALRSVQAADASDPPELLAMIGRVTAMAAEPPADGPPLNGTTPSDFGEMTLSAPTALPDQPGAEAVNFGVAAGADADLAGLLAPPQDPGELGRVDGYRVFRVLGRGGMGAVFEAEDLKLGRRVALKVMLPAVAASPTAKKRFLQEAKAAAAVEHDHIVPIYQVGEDRGMPFIAMPFLRGEPLDERLRGRKPLATADVLLIGRQIAEGLAAAHAAGLIHRDIKPSNIWLERHADGTFKRVRILDFGLARSVREEGEHLTNSGAILGTPAYMAPEQARGLPVDHRADLFSLGGVLYQMATGRRAFTGTDTFAILTALATETPPSPRAIDPTLSPALSDLIVRLLAKEPASRPQTAQAVADELTRIATALPLRPVSASATEIGTPQAALTPPADVWADVGEGKTEPDATPRSAPTRRRNGRLLWVAAGVLFLGLIGAGTYYGKTVVRVATNQGELVIEVDDPTIEVQVKQGEAVLVDKSRDREFVLKGGSGEVEFFDPETGVRTVTRKFEIVRGKRAVVTATMAEVATARPGPKVGEKPDAERKAAEELHKFAHLVLRMQSGKQVDLSPKDQLPIESFVIVGVNWVRNDVYEYIQNGILPSDRSANVYFPAVENLRHLIGLEDHHCTLSMTEEQLGRLADNPSAANMTYLLAGFELTHRTLDILKRFPKLAALGCRGNLTNDEVLRRLAEFPKLKSLALHGLGGSSQVGPDGLAALSKLPLDQLLVEQKGVWTRGFARQIASMPTLETLWVSVSEIGDDISSELAHSPKLRFLQFTDVHVSDTGLEHLKDLQSLRVLALFGSKATEAGVQRLAAARPDLKIIWEGKVIGPNSPVPAPLTQEQRKALEWVLSVGGAVWVNEYHGGMPPIREPKDLPAGPLMIAGVSLEGVSSVNDDTLDRLRDLPPLTHLLNLNGTAITDAGVEKVARFSGTNQIVHFWLAETKVTDIGLISLTKLPRLCEINLYKTAITSAGVAHLAKLPRLVSLNLIGTRIDDFSLLSLKPHKLEFLNLNGTKVSDEGMNDLGAQTSLYKLTLANTKITDKGVKRLGKLTRLDELRGCPKSDLAVSCASLVS